MSKGMKCDICGKFDTAWFEPNGLCDYWINNRDYKKVETICLDCKNKINEKIGRYIKEELIKYNEKGGALWE